MSFGNAPCRNAEWAWALMLVLACVAGWGLNEGLFQYWSVSAVPVGVRRRRVAWAWALALVLACVAARGLVRAQQCRRVAASVTVGTSRNASGHWEARILLQRSSELPDRGIEGLQLDVQPSTAMCGSTRHDAVLVTLQGPPPGPGAGFVAAAGGFYGVRRRNATWAEAKAACEAEGAHLLLIESPAEDQAVARLIAAERDQPTCYWVGFHDMDREGRYQTIFGEPLSSLGYERWHSGQPDDYNNAEDCGTITLTGGLNDYLCTKKTYFICEQRVV